jgi:hypothetical protein
MYRFLFPAFVMIAAIVVLLAGALGDFPSLPDMTRDWAAYFASTTPERATSPTSDSTPAASMPTPTPAASMPTPTPAASMPTPTPAASMPTPTPAASMPTPTPAASKPISTPTAPDYHANQLPTSDTLGRQAAGLQAQIAQRSRELASLDNSEDQARHELDALHQQRQTEQAAITQLQARQKQMAAAAPYQTPAPAQPASQSAPAPSDNPPVQTAPVPPRAMPQYSRRQTQPASAPPRHITPQSAQPQTPQDDLANARELLVSGRPADARQLLVLAQAQSELSPVTPDQPSATGGNVTATRISDAIRFLDTGNTKYALWAINMAMDSTTTGTRAWPASPPPTPYNQRYQPGPAY